MLKKAKDVIKNKKWCISLLKKNNNNNFGYNYFKFDLRYLKIGLQLKWIFKYQLTLNYRYERNFITINWVILMPTIRAT